MHIMKIESQQSDGEVLAGLVERVTYKAPGEDPIRLRRKTAGWDDE
jgi:hypothetical protein